MDAFALQNAYEINYPVEPGRVVALVNIGASVTNVNVLSGSNTIFFFLNTRVAPFDDRRVRLAVNYAFDRQRFTRLLGPGFEPTCQIIPPNFPSYRRICLYGTAGAAGLAPVWVWTLIGGDAAPVALL